jgi:hypothetical protein
MGILRRCSESASEHDAHLRCQESPLGATNQVKEAAAGWRVDRGSDDNTNPTNEGETGMRIAMTRLERLGANMARRLLRGGHVCGLRP